MTVGWDNSGRYRSRRWFLPCLIRCVPDTFFWCKWNNAEVQERFLMWRVSRRLCSEAWAPAKSGFHSFIHPTSATASLLGTRMLRLPRQWTWVAGNVWSGKGIMYIQYCNCGCKCACHKISQSQVCINCNGDLVSVLDGDGKRSNKSLERDYGFYNSDRGKSH